MHSSSDTRAHEKSEFSLDAGRRLGAPSCTSPFLRVVCLFILTREKGGRRVGAGESGRAKVGGTSHSGSKDVEARFIVMCATVSSRAPALSHISAAPHAQRFPTHTHAPAHHSSRHSHPILFPSVSFFGRGMREGPEGRSRRSNTETRQETVDTVTEQCGPVTKNKDSANTHSLNNKVSCLSQRLRI